LGTDVLLLQRVTGVEAVSQLFRFQFEMLAESTATVKFESILGQSVTASLVMPAVESKRYINGIVSRFSQGRRRPSVEGSATLNTYRAEVVPQFWKLTRNYQSRIFQQLSVPDILKKVLTGLKVSYQLQGQYKPRDYCVQYRESDFAFASRLMEEEGIFYFFTHADGSHQMVVADTPQSFVDVPGPTSLIYETVEGGTRLEDRIQRWEKSQMIRSGRYRLWDSYFELPGKNLESVKPALGTVQVGTVTHSLTVGNTDLEIYDYPGGYAQRFDGMDPGGGDRPADVQNIFPDGMRTVGLRMQEETAASILLEGESTCRQLVAGGKFSLTRHFDGNGSYVLTRVEHLADLGDAYVTGNVESMYVNTFQCIPAALPYRPERTIPRPRIDGTQPAVVVGNPGDEIFTDKYGRIKVQFPWDREGKNNADSSCWIRVATPWAGAQWGIIHIPRVGMEVLIAFEEGDPDRPICVGCVYNAQEMPPYTLADNKTQSGYLSRSTLKGSSDNFNQLRFEDKKGEEEVYFHAEKDFNRVVENNDTLKVGFDKKDKGDQTVQIYNNHSLSVGEGKVQAADGSQTITVFNNQTVKIGDPAASGGSQTVTIYKDQTETLQMGNRSVNIDMGNDTLTIKLGNQTTKLNLGTSSTEAMQSITLKVGANSIKVDQMGITIEGMMVKINGQVQTQVQGTMVQVSGSAMTQISGAITMIG
jgi:type VI secretion system secreted protein VgrG